MKASFRVKLIVFTLLGVLALAIVLNQAGVFAPEPAALNDLHSVEELQTQFNQDVGRPRLILLLSPT